MGADSPNKQAAGAETAPKLDSPHQSVRQKLHAIDLGATTRLPLLAPAPTNYISCIPDRVVCAPNFGVSALTWRVPSTSPLTNTLSPCLPPPASYFRHPSRSPSTARLGANSKGTVNKGGPGPRTQTKRGGSPPQIHGQIWPTYVGFARLRIEYVERMALILDQLPPLSKPNEDIILDDPPPQSSVDIRPALSSVRD